MNNKLSRNRLIADMMIFIVLFSLSVHIFIIGISVSSGRGFSGIVYADPGVPVSNAIVMASGSEGFGFAATDPSGHYVITQGLKTGNYTVTVMAEGYLMETIEDVPVTVGMEITGIDFYLTYSGGISGRVTDAISGLPLQNIVVTAYVSGGGTYGWSVFTDANGDYRIITNLGPGTYNVTVFMPEGYIMKTVSGVPVVARVETTGVDLALERSGIISGRVTNLPPDNAPLEGAMIAATSDDGEYSGLTYTNATGYYRLSSGLGAGTYTVTALYFIGFVSDEITDVNVVAGEETPNIDFALDAPTPTPSGIITGRVTDMGGEPIEDALVTAAGTAGNGEDYTDENGDYVISSGLGTGTYTVFASAAGYSPQQITGVNVVVNQVTSDIDFQLDEIPPEQSGRISGTVQGDEDPLPEFPYPLATLMIVTLIAVVLIKIFNAKTRRAHLPIESNIN